MTSLPLRQTSVQQRTRWTLHVCPHCLSEWGPVHRHHPMHCEECGRAILGRKLATIDVVRA